MYYFVISNSDGDTTVEKLTKMQLEDRLNPEDCYYGSDINFINILDEPDTNYWKDKILIIKGEICVPKPIESITKFEI